MSRHKRYLGGSCLLGSSSKTWGVLIQPPRLAEGSKTGAMKGIGLLRQRLAQIPHRQPQIRCCQQADPSIITGAMQRTPCTRKAQTCMCSTGGVCRAYLTRSARSRDATKPAGSESTARSFYSSQNATNRRVIHAVIKATLS